MIYYFLVTGSLSILLLLDLNSLFSCSLLNHCTAWLPPIFVTCFSPTPRLAHYDLRTRAFSLSLGIASLQWGADHSVLLHLNSGILSLAYSVVLIIFLNLNHYSKLTYFLNVIIHKLFCISLCLILFCCMLSCLYNALLLFLLTIVCHHRLPFQFLVACTL